MDQGGEYRSRWGLDWLGCGAGAGAGSGVKVNVEVLSVVGAGAGTGIGAGLRLALGLVPSLGALLVAGAGIDALPWTRAKPGVESDITSGVGFGLTLDMNANVRDGLRVEAKMKARAPAWGWHCTWYRG